MNMILFIFFEKRSSRSDERCPRAPYILFYSTADVVGTGPSTGNTATSTAGMVPASRTLESHNTMQQRQHASSPFPKVYSMYLSSNCSLPYVFSNSFHPRISTGHQGMHMYLAWLLVFCLFWEGWLLVCWVDLALGWMGLETPLSPLDVRSPS